MPEMPADGPLRFTSVHRGQIEGNKNWWIAGWISISSLPAVVRLLAMSGNLERRKKVEDLTTFRGKSLKQGHLGEQHLLCVRGKCS